MSKTGFTTLPCPGCGQKNERKRDSVCPDCLEMIQTGKEHVKLYNELKSDKDMVECQVPFGWDGPRFHTFRTNQHNESLEPLGKILTEISQLVCVPAHQKIHYGYMRYLENRPSFSVDDGGYGGRELPVVFVKQGEGKSEFHHQGKAVMPKKIFDALCRLTKAIEFAIAESEKGAVEYGKNALLMLNDGKLRMDEFNSI